MCRRPTVPQQMQATSEGRQTGRQTNSILCLAKQTDFLNQLLARITNAKDPQPGSSIPPALLLPWSAFHTVDLPWLPLQ